MPTATDAFPTLLSCTRLATTKTIFDVKFYPYATKDDDQIFAFVVGESAVVCRPKLDAEPPFEILRWLSDEQHAVYNSVAWARNPANGKPWLCIAGEEPKHIKILDIESGKPVRTVSGHGKAINDLAVSPLSSSLLVSASSDHSIRFWNLEESHKNQPCVALLSGEGHKAPVLAINFHPNGRWLLSGGIDTAVCLWSIPDPTELRRSVNDGIAETKEPRIIYYPHFYTKELHFNYVDCLAFYGDLIISRSARPGDNRKNEILIWKIDGFDSDEPAPVHPPIPAPSQRTRSAFPHQDGFRGFQRLLTLTMPMVDRFYFRFGLYHSPSKRPILAMGSLQSDYCFWDLQLLERGIGWHKERPKRSKSKSNNTSKSSDAIENLKQSDDPRRTASPATGSTAGTSETASNPPATESLDILGDRFKGIQPHLVVADVGSQNILNKQHFTTSQIGWSPDGTWMIGVGENGMMSIWHRDESVGWLTES